MTISDDACTATADYSASPESLKSLARITNSCNPFIAASRKSLHRGVEDVLARPPDDERGHGAAGFDGDVEADPGLADALGFEVVLDVLTVLLRGAFGVVDHPVGTPVIFQDLLVDQPQDFDGGLDVVRPAVGIAVDHLDVFVQR